MKRFIQHRGVVKHAGDGRIVVCIEQQSACAACHAKSACLVSDKKEKLIEVKGESRQFAPGEEVMVVAQSSSGMLAVVLAFAVPFVLEWRRWRRWTRGAGHAGWLLRPAVRLPREGRAEVLILRLQTRCRLLTP